MGMVGCGQWETFRFDIGSSTLEITCGGNTLKAELYAKPQKFVKFFFIGITFFLPLCS